jgi:hypothetical protein
MRVPRQEIASLKIHISHNFQVCLPQMLSRPKFKTAQLYQSQQSPSLQTSVNINPTFTKQQIASGYQDFYTQQGTSGRFLTMNAVPP